MAGIGTAVMPVIPSLRGMSSAIEKELGSSTKGAGKVAGKNVSGGILGGLKGIAGPIGALFAVGGAIDFFKEANDEAREAQKVGATTTQIIKTTGGAAKITSAQVGDLATAISNKTGMDDEAIQKGANLILTFKNVRNEAGKGGAIFDRATQAAADLSAAGFGSVESASKSLGKALNDPVKGLSILTKSGVTFTDQQKAQVTALVKGGDAQAAVATGLLGSTQEYSAALKRNKGDSTKTYNEITKGLSKAQKARFNYYAEGGHELEAQKIVLKEVEGQVGGVAAASATAGEKLAVAFGNFKEQIGTALLPIIDRFANVMVATVFPAVSSFVGFIAKNAPAAFAAIKGAVAPVIAAFGGLGGGTSMVVSAFRAISAFVQAELIPRFLSIVGTVRGLAAVVLPIVRQIAGTIVGVFRANLPTIMTIFATVKQIITGAMGLIQAVIGRVTTVISVIWSMFGGTILRVLKVAFTTVIGVVKGALNIISGVIKLATAIFKGDWSGAWAAIKQIVSGAWTVIKSVISGAFGIIKAAFSAVGIAIKGIWSAMWGGIKTTASATWALIQLGVSTAFGAVRGLFTSAGTAIKTTWTNFWDGIKLTGSTAMGLVKSSIDTVLGKIKTAFSTAKTNIKAAWDGVKEIVRSPIRWVVDNVYNTPLVPVWNRVAELVGGTKLATYATGGIHGIRPGYTPGRDTHTIGVGGGEAIMRPEWTRAAGSDYIHAANRAASQGGLPGVQRFLDRNGVPGIQGPREHFASGGIAGWAMNKLSGARDTLASAASTIKGWAVGGLKAAAEAVLKPVRSLITANLSGTPLRSTVGGVANKALSSVLDKIGASDSAAAAAGGDRSGNIVPVPGGGNLVNYRGHRFTAQFANRLQRANARAPFGIFQGGFRPRTSYSGTSHQGDAVDTTPGARIVNALRAVGIAAWDRTGKGNWAPHNHGVPLPGAGSAGGSAIWQAQDYLRGGDGLRLGGIVPGYARGTRSAAPGLAVVGERGRELVDFGRGGQRVLPNRTTEQALGQQIDVDALGEAVAASVQNGIERGLRALTPRDEAALIRRGNQYANNRGGR